MAQHCVARKHFTVNYLQRIPQHDAKALVNMCMQMALGLWPRHRWI